MVTEPTTEPEETADASAVRHEDSSGGYDSDSLSDEDEEDDTADRGWGTYATIAAAIDAGRKVCGPACHNPHICEGLLIVAPATRHASLVCGLWPPALSVLGSCQSPVLRP